MSYIINTKPIIGDIFLKKISQFYLLNDENFNNSSPAKFLLYDLCLILDYPGWTEKQDQILYGWNHIQNLTAEKTMTV